MRDGPHLPTDLLFPAGRRGLVVVLSALAALCLFAACAKSDNAVPGGAGAAGGTDAGADASGGADSGGGSAGAAATGGTGGSAGLDAAAGTGGASGMDGGAGVDGAAGTAGTAGDAGNSCSTPGDCPSTGSECVLATCTAGVCGTQNVAAGVATPTQTLGDCHKALCDGQGGIISANDDSDVPDDKNPCTTDGCSNGIPTHNPVAAGTSCGTNLVCDSAGNCGGCAQPSDCPGQDTACQTRTCTAGVCGMSFAPAGTKLSTQTPGDCKVVQCDGSGNAVTVTDSTDVPVDGKQCTSDQCVNGVPQNPASPAGTPCSENGGTVCDGSGTCVPCSTGADCPGTDTDCSQRTCNNGTCGMHFTAAGTATTNQTPGDCKQNVCDGSGGVTTNVDNSDVPVDGRQCTSDVCTNGTPSNPPLASGTSCSQSGGKLCDGSGNCVECLTGSDCASGICQSNVCNSVTCGSGTVDCDGLSSNGCECSGNSCCGTSCSPQHHNGLGQTYQDCSPLGVPGNAATYTVTMANEARGVWPNTGTDGTGKCTGPNGGNAVYRQTTTSCAVWGYTGGIAGYVMLNTANNNCTCPSPTGTTWD